MNKNFSTTLPNFFVNSSYYYFVVIDFNATYLYVNKKFQERCAFIHPDLVNTSVFDSIHPEDAKKFVGILQDCVADNTKTICVELRKKTKQDIWFWTHWEFSLYIDSTNTIIGIIGIGHDSTEKYQQEKTIAQTNTILDNISDGLYVLNKDWCFELINPVAEKIFQHSKEFLLGKNIWEVIPNADDYIYPIFFRKVAEKKTTAKFKDYSIPLGKWFEVSVYPNHNGIIVFFQDITEKHLMQTQLKQSENKLRAIMDSGIEGSILISTDWKVLSFNQVALKEIKSFMGYDLAEGKPILDYVQVVSQQDFIKNFEKALEGEIVMVEYPIFLDNEEVCWFEFKYFPVYDATHELIGINLTAYNIDKRKKAEEKITISENKLSAFYNSSTDSHILLDKDLKIIAFNKSARELSLYLYGKEIKEGEKMTDFVLPEALIDLQTNFARALGGEKRMLERERYFKKTQEKIWFLINYFPVYDNHHTILGVALHTVNITNLKQKEAKIKLQNKILKEIAWQQSHEVRKPVANILGLVNILRITNNLADANEREEYLQHLYQASNELDAVIHKIVEKAGILYRKELFKPI